MAEPVGTVTLEVQAGNISSQLIREMAKTERSFMQTVQSAISKGTKAGVSEAKLDKVFSKAIDKASKHMSAAAKLMEQAQRTTDAEAKKALLERASIQRKAAEDIFNKETKHQRNLIERRWKAHKKSQEFLDKSNSERIEGLVGAFSSLKGGDVKGVASAAGGAAKVGAGLLGRGAASAAGAGAAGGAAAMGSAASALAAVAAPLAVVAGTLAVIVKLIIDANNQAKEMNKTFLESAGAGDMMFSVMNDGSDQLREGLQDLRSAATDFVHNVRWGTVAEDMVKILTAANEAGLTYKGMASDTSELVNGMKGYLGVTELALRYSKLLGVDAAELASNIAEWEHDLGGGLKTLEESFARITKIAMESGFGVKRFYSMVQQATSGMALYNNRIEETAKLLSTTADILGEQEAKEFIDTLQKGFADEDYSARLKRVLLTGTKDVQEIVGQQAVSTAEKFSEDFGPQLARSLDSVMAGTEMEGMGFDLAMGDPTELVDQLGSMTKEQQSELIGTISATDEAAGRRMKGLVDLATAKATGNVDDLIGALDDLSPSGKLAMLLDKQILGNKTLASMSEREKQIFADTQGLSVKQVEQLERLETTLLGQKKAAERGNESVLRKLGLLSEGFEELTPEQQEAELKKIAEGVKKQSDADFIQKYGKVEEEIAGALTQQEALAQSTVEHTRDISNTLTNGVQFMLERIYTLMEDSIAAFFGMGDAERAEKRKAEEKLRSQLEQFGAGLSKAQDEERKAREAVATAKTKGEKAAAEEALTKAKERTEHAEAQVDLVKKAMGELTVLGSGKFTRDLSTSTADRFVERAMTAVGGRGGMETAAAALGPGGEKKLVEAQAQGEARQAAKGFGLQGALTTQARDIQGLSTSHNVFTRLSAGELPGLGDVARTGADLGTLGTWRAAPAAMGSLFGTAGEAGQRMEGQEAQGELLRKALDEQSEKLTKEEEAARKQQKEQSEKQIKLQEESKKEQERLRKEFPEMFAEGTLRAEAAKTLQAAGFENFTQSDVDVLMGRGGAEAAATLRSKVAARGGEALSEEQRNLFKIGQYMDDFVYQSGGGFAQGTITPINRADQILGAKPGGPVADAVGAGGPASVNITINGGDQARTYETVKRALRAAGIR